MSRFGYELWGSAQGSHEPVEIVPVVIHVRADAHMAAAAVEDDVGSAAAGADFGRLAARQVESHNPAATVSPLVAGRISHPSVGVLAGGADGWEIRPARTGSLTYDHGPKSPQPLAEGIRHLKRPVGDGRRGHVREQAQALSQADERGDRISASLVALRRRLERHIRPREIAGMDRAVPTDTDGPQQVEMVLTH